jgi:sugar phosphate isomerase/epimerase
MKLIPRRTFLKSSVVPMVVPLIASPFAFLGEEIGQHSPAVHFPAIARERIAVASYPFREFIAGKSDAASVARGKMALKDFPGHVVAKFDIHKVEPWSEHFLSLEPSYLAELRDAASKVGAGFANVAADGELSLYSSDARERDEAARFCKQWIDVAVALGSPSVRTNVPAFHHAKPDAGVLAEQLKPVAAYAASRNVVVHLENDNPVSEDPFILVEVLDRANSSWLRALPDFGNSFAALPAEDAYRGLEEMFARSYAISHVKDTVQTRTGKPVSVDLARVFALAAKHDYKGFFSMEWDTEGDVYEGTSKLIAATVKNIS